MPEKYTPPIPESELIKMAVKSQTDRQALPEANETKETSLEELFFQRRIQKEKDALKFQYGELEPQHPTQQYVASLAEHIPLKERFPLQVCVIPDMRETNAMALPDGTIFVARGLLERVKTEQALVGVLAHEYRHVHREHTRKQQQGLNDGFKIVSFLERLSLQRMHELEADMGGVLQDLKKSKVNPIGYKNFLNELQQREARKDIVHGSSGDRALNLADATFAFHFPATEEPLTELPSSVVEALKSDDQKRSHLAICRRPATFAKDEADLSRRYELRKQEVEGLSAAELPQAISMMAKIIRDNRFSQQTKAFTNRKRIDIIDDPEDIIVINTLIKKFTEVYIPDNLPARERRLLSGAALELFCDINTYENDFWEGNSEAQEYFTAPEDFEFLRQKLEQFTEQESLPTYALGSTSILWEQIIKRALKANVFGNLSSEKASLITIEPFLTNWAQTLSSLSKKFDTADTFDKSHFEQIAVELLIPLVSKEFQEKLLFHYRIEQETRFSEKEEAQLLKAGRLLQDTTYDRWGANAKKITEATRKIVAGKSMKAAGTAVDQVLYFSEYGLKHRTQQDWDISVKTNSVFDTFYGAECYVAGELFRRTIDSSSEFAELSEKQKKIVLLTIGQYTGLYGSLKHAQERIKQTEDFDEDDYVDEESRAYFYKKRGERTKRMLKDFNWQTLWEEVLVGCDSSFDLVFLYKNILDEKYYKEKLGTIPWAAPDLAVDAKRFFVQTSVMYLNKLPFGEMVQELDSLENQLPIQQLLTDYATECGPLVEKIIAAVEDDSITTLTLSQVVRISKLVSNPFLQATLQKYIRSIQWPSLNTSERIEAVFPPVGELAINDLTTRDTVLEHDVTTQADYELVKQRMEERVDELLATGNVRVGMATLLDLDLRTISAQDLTNFIKGLLVSGKEDRELKSAVYNLVKTSVSINRDVDKVEIYETEKEGLEKINQSLEVAESLMRIILSLDEIGKHFLLRKLLASEGGVLPRPERRKVFLKMLFGEWVTANKQEQDVQDVLREVEEVLGTFPNWELLYLGLQNSLRTQIANPPDKFHTTAWADVSDVYYDYDTQGLDGEKEARTIIWSTVPRTAKQKPWNYAHKYSNYADEKLRLALEKKGVVSEEGDYKGPVSPLKFVKELGSKLSAIGVRLLQNLPLVTELPEQYTQEFSEVYDRMKGQSKFAALTLLSDEWPELWQEIAQVGDRIGGGSIVTVYEATTTTGEEEVIKVVNPNIKHHLQEIYRFAAEVLDQLANRHEGAYRAARLLLDDIKEWIDKDIGFENFLEQDAEFRKQHQGFKPDNHDYGVYVPQSKGPVNKYFSREEKVVGTNLTNWDKLISDGHDTKQVMSVLVKNYLTQIQQGRALSDVHPGNFAVTPDKRLVIYDRNFFINLSDQEQRIVFTLLNPAAVDKQDVFKEYILTHQDSGIPQEQVERQIEQFVSATTTQEWRGAQRAVIALKQLGVKIPLNLTLLLKNFHSLERMAQQAGFKNGIFDALMFTPS